MMEALFVQHTDAVAGADPELAADLLHADHAEQGRDVHGPHGFRIGLGIAVIDF